MILLPSCAELSAVAPLKQSCVLCWGWQCWVVAEQRSIVLCSLHPLLLPKVPESWTNAVIDKILEHN